MWVVWEKSRDETEPRFWKPAQNGMEKKKTLGFGIIKFSHYDFKKTDM